MSDSTKVKYEGEVDASRRSFIKKASYSAPALITLGMAAHVRNAQGQGFGGPPSAPAAPSSVDPIDDQLLLDEVQKSQG